MRGPPKFDINVSVWSLSCKTPNILFARHANTKAESL